MKPHPLYILYFLLATTFFACQKEPPVPSMNCAAFKRGVLQRNQQAADQEFQKISQDLVANPIAADSIGHLRNLKKAAERINYNCNFGAEVVCYRCIPGLQLQSEISLRFEEKQGAFIYYILLAVDSNEKLYLSGFDW